MQQAVSARVPSHLWVVGILSLLWNCFGAYDYLMTRMHNMDYLSQMGDPTLVISWVEGLPMYAQIGWGLGVWGALLGSLLLLMRSRYAVYAFAASLIGAVMSFSAQYLNPPPPSPLDAGLMKYMPLVIIALAIAQLWYAWREARSGVLR